MINLIDLYIVPNTYYKQYHFYIKSDKLKFFQLCTVLCDRLFTGKVFVTHHCNSFVSLFGTDFLRNLYCTNCEQCIMTNVYVQDGPELTSDRDL